MYHYLLDTSSPDWDLTLQAQGPAPHLVMKMVLTNMRMIMLIMMMRLVDIIMMKLGIMMEERVEMEIPVRANLLKMFLGSAEDRLRLFIFTPSMV